MTDDATLSDFGVGPTGEKEPESELEPEPDDSSADGDSADERDRSPPEDDGADDGSDRPNPSLSTYAWGDHVCSRCGTASDRVWRDGDAFVCPDCKEW